MIEGTGDIASVLEDRDDLLYFARGVSNSQEERESEFDRERNMLLAQGKDRRLVYFGSLSIFYNDNRYTRHKKEMEGIVKAEYPKYCIARIGNIAWGDNPHTLINNLRGKVEREEPIEIRNTYRYVVEEEEFLHWMNLIPDFNCEMNIPGRRMKVKDIVREFVLK